MLPAFVMVHAKIDLHEGTPLGPPRFANEVHARFLRRVVRLASIAGDAGADNVLPSRRAAAIAGDDMVEIQIFAIKDLAAILAGVVVPLENIMTRELDFFLRQPVEHHQQDDAWHANLERDGMDALRMRVLLGEILPLIEAESLERTVVSTEDSLGVAFEEQSESAAGGADVDCLPEAI